MELHPNLRELVDTGCVNARYLWERAKAGDDKLCKKFETVKRKLTEENKQERTLYCSLMMDRPLDYSYRIVWIDEASVMLYPVRRKVIGRRGVESMTYTTHRRLGNGPGVELHYILAVNGACGLVHSECLYDKTLVGTAAEEMVSYKIGGVGAFSQDFKGSL